MIFIHMIIHFQYVLYEMFLLLDFKKTFIFNKNIWSKFLEHVGAVHI